MKINNIIILIIILLLFNCSNDKKLEKYNNPNYSYNILVEDGNGEVIGNIYKDTNNITNAFYNGAFHECKLLEIKYDKNNIYFILKFITNTPDLSEPIIKKYKANLNYKNFLRVIKESKEKEINFKIIAIEI